MKNLKKSYSTCTQNKIHKSVSKALRQIRIFQFKYLEISLSGDVKVLPIFKSFLIKFFILLFHDANVCYLFQTIFFLVLILNGIFARELRSIGGGDNFFY